MAISITVRYDRSEPLPQLQSYDLHVVVESATEMPKEIFIFQQGVAPAYAKNEPPTDRFICLADPVDLEEVPIGAPDIPNEMPYFRLSEVLLRFRSYSELEDTRNLLGQDIQRLVNSLKAAASLPVTDEVTYV